MIKGLGLTLIILGGLSLILGIIGIFGSNLLPVNSWALAILGIIFFPSGIKLLKYKKDTDETL